MAPRVADFAVFLLWCRRVAELEKKIDDLYSHIQAGPVQQHTAALQALQPAASSATATTIDRSLFNQPVASPFTDSRTGCLGTPDSLPTFEEPFGRADVIQKGIITEQEAQELVKTFEMNFSSYSFLQIPSSSKLASFRRERPFLLLAVLTIASRKHITLQELLEQEFNETFGARLIVEASKDLDLLQGLLTHLAWYYLILKLPLKQMYMLAQIAVTMALDLDLETQLETGGKTQASAEVKRTFLAVYQISSSISMFIRKPITMGYNDNIGDCCRSLAAANIAPTDKHLVHFIYLQRVAEDISSVFGYNSVSRQPQGISTQAIDLSVKAFKSQLHAVWQSLPADTACHPPMILTYQNLYIHLYEVCLMTKEPAGDDLKARELQRGPNMRTTLLFDCLEATKTFLDQYLQLPRQEVMGHSILQKGQIAHALVVLMKLAFSPNPGLEVSSWRQACRVEHYLDALGERAGCVGTDHDVHDAFWHFKKIARLLKAWYQRIEMSGTSGSPAELKGMSPLQFAEIVRDDSSFNTDFTSMDFGGMDFLFLPGANFWE